MDTDIRRLGGIGRVKGWRIVWGQETLQGLLVGSAPRAVGDAEAQLVHHDRRDQNARAAAHLFAQPTDRRRRAARHDPYDDVCIEAEHQSKEMSSSLVHGGCSGRPSGRKSWPARAWTLASHLSKSNFFSIGSRRTALPTLRTRTSLPGSRNSFGSRTAWLRPCMKIFAVVLPAISSPVISINDRY